MSASWKAEASGAETPVRYCPAANEPSHSRAELGRCARSVTSSRRLSTRLRGLAARSLVALYFSVADSARR